MRPNLIKHFVILCLSITAFASCDKQPKIAAPKYVPVQGTYLFHHTFEIHAGANTTGGAMSDTSLTLAVINPSYIYLYGDTLGLEYSTDTVREYFCRPKAYPGNSYHLHYLGLSNEMIYTHYLKIANATSREDRYWYP